VIYGNFGNDLLFANEGTSDSHEYGGQGNDTLVFTGTGGGSTINDVETGGLGNDLFIASNNNGGGAITANDIVTVTDFLSGTDKLAETSVAVHLVKIKGTNPSGDNAQQALNDANNGPFFAVGPTSSEYVFVYGGTGAGYLFYNGNTKFAISGMAITGANGQNSVNASDITTIPNNIHA